VVAGSNPAGPTKWFFYSFGALIIYVTFKDYFSMSLIVAKNLSKSYGSVVAVDSLNLSLDEGSNTGLIGAERRWKKHYNQDDSWLTEAR
jgi:hypothetical protein